MENFKVMLAKPFEEKRVSFPTYISPKLDGVRAFYYKGEFYTRNRKQLKGLSHLKEVLAEHERRLDQSLWLDGELIVPGMTFQKSSGLIRNYHEVPEAHYHVFDIPSEATTPFNKRVQLLHLMLGYFKLPQINVVPHDLVTSLDSIYDAYTEERRKGGEGLMVKSYGHYYKDKRSYDWMKIKAVETVDVICTGFFEGQGRLVNTLGGIFVEFEGVEVRVGGGFSDIDRDEIWHNKSKYIGRVCEVAYQEITPDGSLRHPRFIDWRFDKDEISS